MAAHINSQSFSNKHYEGEMSLYPDQNTPYHAIVGSLLHLSINQHSEAGIQRLESIHEDQDQTEVNAVEKQLFDFEETYMEMLSCASNEQQEPCGEVLPWYYFARISPNPLNPTHIRPTYNTKDSFQLHTWIMADGEMGASLTSNQLLEYLPLSQDNVDVIERYLENYLQDFLDRNIGRHLWVYLAMPEFKDEELLDIMSLQIDQIRASLTSFADELSVTVDVVNWADWVKAKY